MKKLFYLGLTALMACTLIGCAGSEANAGKAAKKYAQYVVDGKYDAFVDVIAFEEGTTPEKIEQGKVMVKALLADKGAKEMEKKGGVKNIEIVSEQVDESAEKAKVVLKYTYGNETTEDNTVNLVKQDGKWLVDMDK